MILVIGGAFQGKKDYAKEAFSLADEDFTDGACCSEEELYQAKAVVHLHEYVRRCLQEGRELTGLADRIRISSFWQMSWEAAWCLWTPLTGAGERRPGASAASWRRGPMRFTG